MSWSRRAEPLLLALALAACEREAPPPAAPAPAAARAAPSFAALGGLSYPLVGTQPETVAVALAQGRYEPDPAQPDGERLVASAELATLYAVGELDGDGSPDAAVVLAWSGGGSGTFYELFAVLNEPGGLRVLDGQALGDRIVLERIVVLDGRVRIGYLGAGPDDPACCPSAKLDKAFALEGGRLVEVPLPPTSL